jgi:hypothetical protein
MQIGQYEIPDVRLYPDCISYIKIIYDAIGSDGATSLDVAKILGHSTNESGAFYRKYNSLTAYGLIERRGKNIVTELGKRLAYPENDNARKHAMKEAILNIFIWSELYKRFKKNIPSENLWVQIRNISGIEAPLAQKLESQIRKTYLEDISQISEELVEANENRKSYSSEDTKTTMSLTSDLIDRNKLEKIPFGKDILIFLPKDNLRKSWEKAQKYMELYLEDYQEPTIENVEVIVNDTDSTSIQEHNNLSTEN